MPNFEDVLRFFEYDHLPKHLQEVSKPFKDLATSVVDRKGNFGQVQTTLTKLLEAKDAAVRAVL